MSEGSSFSQKISFLSSKNRTSDLVAFLDTLPQASVLIHSDTWSIIYPNQRILEFGQYTRSELTGADVRTLFSDWFESPKSGDEGQKSNLPISTAVIKRLIRHDQTQLLFRVYISPVKNQESYSIIILEPAEMVASFHDQGSSSPFWKSLNELVNAENEPDLNVALDKALSAAANLSGAEIVTVYQLAESQPEIKQLAFYGDNQLLPAILSMQDLVALKEARLWEPGKHPSCSLYRAARSVGLRYLASAPIGENTAMVGLVVIGSTRSAPPTFIVSTVEILATMFQAMFQSHIHRDHLSNELSQQSLLTQRLSIIAERVQEGIIQLSPELEIRSINPRMEKLLGYSKREILGQQAGMILIGNDTLMPALANAQKGEAMLDQGELNLYRRDGELFRAQVRIFPVMHDEHVDEILVFIQDFSEKIQTEMHAQELQNRAGLGELMAVFSHEARNPINNISTGLQVLKDSFPSEDPIQGSISRMRQDCVRLGDLLNSVLNYTKPLEYKMENLDFGQFMQQLFEKQRAIGRYPKIRYELHIDPNCPPISGNRSALEQVFVNLIENAVQAMGEEGGVLSLKVQPASTNQAIQYVEAYVADTGPGIPDQIKKDLFHPFITTKKNGNGLGLSIAKKIITTHKGDIQFTSVPGGTVFQVRLPAIEVKGSQI
jgi:PAS domain S-box-containing protein